MMLLKIQLKRRNYQKNSTFKLNQVKSPLKSKLSGLFLLYGMDPEFTKYIQSLGLDLDNVEAHAWAESPLNWSVEYTNTDLDVSFSWIFPDDCSEVPNWMRYDPKEGF